MKLAFSCSCKPTTTKGTELSTFMIKNLAAAPSVLYYSKSYFILNLKAQTLENTI